MGPFIGHEQALTGSQPESPVGRSGHVKNSVGLAGRFPGKMDRLPARRIEAKHVRLVTGYEP